MKLTINLKRCIIVEFKAGDSMELLAKFHKLPLLKVENIIRQELNEQDKKAETK